MDFKLILEHKVTHKLMFITIEECEDLDECLEHILQTAPDFQIEQVTPIH